MSPGKGSVCISPRAATGRCRSLGTRRSDLTARLATRRVQNIEQLVQCDELAAMDLGSALPDANELGVRGRGRRIAVRDVDAQGLPNELGACAVLLAADLVDRPGPPGGHRNGKRVGRAPGG